MVQPCDPKPWRLRHFEASLGGEGHLSPRNKSSQNQAVLEKPVGNECQAAMPGMGSLEV